MELTYLNNQNSLFKKYASLVTSLTKHQLFRDYVGLKEQVDLLLPNGYHKIVDMDKKGQLITGQAVFTTRPIFVPKLYRALAGLDLLQRWVENFKEAQMVLMGNLDLLSWGKIPSYARYASFDVATYYPDADAETTTVDGYVGRSSVDETLAVIRAGAGTHSSDSVASSNSPYFAASTTSNQFGSLFRNIYLFDASSLGDTYVINSAVFSVYGFDRDNQFGGSPEIDCVSSSPASNTALVNADYGQLGSTVFSSIAHSGWATTGYNDFTLDSNGRNNISTTGISKFGTRLNWDTDNSFGGSWGGSLGIRFDGYFADETGTSKDPKLVVTYTPNSPSVSVSLSPSISASRSPSLSFSASPSLSPSFTSSPSPSLSPSASVSPSSSISLSSSLSSSLSPSLSQSATESVSVSSSISLSPSPSPSCGYTRYSRGAYESLPTGTADLDNLYTEEDEVGVETNNTVYIEQTGAGQYMVHQFKTFVAEDTSCEITSIVQSSLAPTSSTVYLQIYNHSTNTWDTIDSDNTSSVDTDFTLTAEVLRLSRYKDGSNVIATRIYQLTM